MIRWIQVHFIESISWSQAHPVWFESKKGNCLKLLLPIAIELAHRRTKVHIQHTHTHTELPTCFERTLLRAFHFMSLYSLYGQYSVSVIIWLHRCTYCMSALVYRFHRFHVCFWKFGFLFTSSHFFIRSSSAAAAAVTAEFMLFFVIFSLVFYWPIDFHSCFAFYYDLILNLVHFTSIFSIAVLHFPFLFFSCVRCNSIFPRMWIYFCDIIIIIRCFGCGFSPTRQSVCGSVRAPPLFMYHWCSEQWSVSYVHINNILSDKTKSKDTKGKQSSVCRQITVDWNGWKTTTHNGILNTAQFAILSNYKIEFQLFEGHFNWLLVSKLM